MRNLLKGKRLLLVGGINTTADLIELAHRNGVFLGVADYNKDTYVKKRADAAHEINALDVDAVAKLFTDEGYDGVISNFTDMLAPYVTKIAEKLGCPVPYTVEQLRMSTDKKYFKQVCNAYGVPVPREYTASSEDIPYPVIVKPVDGSASKGISICKNADELEKGVEKAKAASKSGEVIVEEYIVGDEINVTYIVQEGIPQLAAIHDRYFNETQEGVVHVPDLYIYPSRYTDSYMAEIDPLVVGMLKGIGLKNGSLFMQACVRDGKVYFYEAGMRLNGCKTYQILEYENKYNTFEHLMRYALTGSMGEFRRFSPKFRKWYATLNVLGEPGGTVERFEGVDELKTYPWLIGIARRMFEGDTIPLEAKGTLIQDTTRIHLCADTKEELIERINIVNDLYRLISPDGRNIILTPHDTEEVYRGLDYDLV